MSPSTHDAPPICLRAARIGAWLLPAMLLAASATSAATIVISSDIDVSTRWTPDNEYVLDRPIYVLDGATLTIEPGTVIRGEAESAPGALDPGSLIVARGARLVAQGTRTRPIIFTNMDDDNVGASSGTAPYDDAANALGITGTWGGLIMLGRAHVANNTASGPDGTREVQIEGLAATGGLGFYGNCAASGLLPEECDDDDSGILEYVSLRYGGFNLSANNEINGLTLGGVGRSTVIDHVEVFQNRDDGIEMFGGTVDMKHVVVIHAGDDSIDYDEGWRGRLQYGLVVQGSADLVDPGDKGGEHDGGNGPDGSLPLTTPMLRNVTSIGLGQGTWGTALNNSALLFRDNAGGRYHDSLFLDYAGAAVLIEGGNDGTSTTAPATSGERSMTAYAQDGLYQVGPDSRFQLELSGNTWWCIGAGATIPSGMGAATPYGGQSGKLHHDPGVFSDPSFDNEHRDCATPMPIRSLTRMPSPDPLTLPDITIGLDPRPAPGSGLVATSTPAGGFFDTTSYRGAFGDINWADGWTNAARLGYFPAETRVLITEDITTSTTWTSDKEYVLDRPIYVRDGATLSIQAGTVIRGESESAPGANDPGTLIVARGSRIEAIGAADCPIVFTNLDDDNVGHDAGTAPYDTIENAQGITGTWGGLILLGRGYVANNTASGADATREVQIEGLAATGGLGFYGNCAAAGLLPDECDDDDSGILRHVSLRYGGFNLSANNEINGLTLGGVGRGTEIDSIEVFQNRDDGVELFGGAVNLKRIVIVNSGDDSLDYDEGWRGKAQFIFVAQGSADGVDPGDKGGEHDGGNGPDGSLPLTTPAIYNATFIGQGQGTWGGVSANTALLFRDNAGGRYHASVFADFGGAGALIEGGNDGTSLTAPGTSGERAITPYTRDGLHHLGPDSRFQLELSGNDYWCLGAGPNIPQGMGSATPFGGQAGKLHFDPGVFSDPTFDNTFADCATPHPFVAFQRAPSPDPLTLPDPLVSVDPRPAPGSGLWTARRAAPRDGFFENAPWTGAFGSENWASGWTVISRLGLFAPAQREIVSSDITTSTTWTADREWVLDRPIYVTSGATLTIEAGTTVRGEPESAPGATDPGTLIVARGSKLFARGTAERPIVFTNLDDDNIGASHGTAPYDSYENALGITGTWGGIIMLGRGYVANNTASGADATREVQIEGLSATGGLGFYGNCAAAGLLPEECDDDDSGVLEHVSIRYGGYNLSANNEINGLTLGGVGRGTTIDAIEIFQNRDDGIEFFGGAVNVTRIAVFNSGDDSVDYDEGWRGKAQFLFALQGSADLVDTGDKAGEHDGGNGPDGSLPRTTPAIYNATYVGLGQGTWGTALGNSALLFRDNAGGRYHDSVFADFAGAAVLIEGGNDGTSQTAPATSGERSITPYVADGMFQLDQGSSLELELSGNVFWCMGAGATIPQGIGAATPYGGQSGKLHHDPGIFTNPAFDNEYHDCASELPMRNLVRAPSIDPATLPDLPVRIDPRPTAQGPLWGVRRGAPADGFFQRVGYVGAFGDTNWLEGWSNASRLGLFPACSESPTAIPGEVAGLRFHEDKQAMGWQPLAAPGCEGTLTYDVLRASGPLSADAHDFSEAVFIERRTAGLRAVDPATPPSGEVFFYVVRAEGECGSGTLGRGSDHVERIAP